MQSGWTLGREGQVDFQVPFPSELAEEAHFPAREVLWVPWVEHWGQRMKMLQAELWVL